MSLAFHTFTRRWLPILLSALVLILAGCSSSPENTVENFYKAVAANRVDEAISYFSLKDVKQNDLTAVKGKFQMMIGGEYSQIQAAGGLDSITVHTVKQDGNTAEVKATLKLKNGETHTESFHLIEDSGWKIVP